MAIDLIGDYHAVIVDEKGSRSMMELFGRTGISVAAGVGRIVDGTVLSAIVGATIPVLAVLILGGLVIMGAAALVSYTSGGIKNAIYN